MRWLLRGSPIPRIKRNAHREGPGRIEKAGKGIIPLLAEKTSKKEDSSLKPGIQKGSYSLLLLKKKPWTRKVGFDVKKRALGKEHLQDHPVRKKKKAAAVAETEKEWSSVSRRKNAFGRGTVPEISRPNGKTLKKNRGGRPRAGHLLFWRGGGPPNPDLKGRGPLQH